MGCAVYRIEREVNVASCRIIFSLSSLLMDASVSRLVVDFNFSVRFGFSNAFNELMVDVLFREEVSLDSVIL